MPARPGRGSPRGWRHHGSPRSRCPGRRRRRLRPGRGRNRPVPRWSGRWPPRRADRRRRRRLPGPSPLSGGRAIGRRCLRPQPPAGASSWYRCRSRQLSSRFPPIRVPLDTFIGGSHAGNVAVKWLDVGSDEPSDRVGVADGGVGIVGVQALESVPLVASDSPRRSGRGSGRNEGIPIGGVPNGRPAPSLGQAQRRRR